MKKKFGFSFHYLENEPVNVLDMIVDMIYE